MPKTHFTVRRNTQVANVDIFLLIQYNFGRGILSLCRDSPTRESISFSRTLNLNQ